MLSKRLVLLAAVVGGLMLIAGYAVAADTPTCTTGCVTEYAPGQPAVYNGPFGLARGLGDDIWFGDQNTIARIDRSGAVTSYETSPGAGVGWVIRGDGVMWFTERFTDKIGSVDNNGNVTEYPIPTPNSGPQGLAVDTAGIIWFTEQNGDKIGRLDPLTGTITEYQVPTASAGPLGLAFGPDGALWFVERNAAKIGRMTTDGDFTEYPLAASSSPQRIVVGPDGALWFTELGSSRVGRITTSGSMNEYAVPGGPVGITTMPSDQALYVVLFNAGSVARVALDGTITDEWATPSANSAPLQIAAGSGRDLWLSESFLSSTGNKIARLEPFAH